MTGKQLKRMLSFEGLYYAVGTIITSAVLGVLFSVVVVQGISSGIWFFTYQFVMWPMLVIYPFLILLTVAIPALLYRQIARASYHRTAAAVIKKPAALEIEPINKKERM